VEAIGGGSVEFAALDPDLSAGAFAHAIIKQHKTNKHILIFIVAD